eukprot:1840560-Rhodomonas_salina.1
MVPPLCEQDSTGNQLAKAFFFIGVANAADVSVWLDCSTTPDVGGVQRTMFSPGNFTPRGSGWIPARQVGDGGLAWEKACEACGQTFQTVRHKCTAGLELAVPQIRSSLQGVAERWRAEQGSEGTELDEAVVYLRCGDILAQPWHSGYGWVQYRAYLETLDPETATIGIISTPFDNGTCRTKDCGFRRDCERVVADLKHFLIEFFPRARVSVHNRPEETVRHAFSRMVLARQVFCNPSTFCLFPTVASADRGYIVASKLYPWVELLDRPEARVLKVLRHPFLSMSMIEQVIGRKYIAGKPWSNSEFARLARWLRTGTPGHR